MAERGFFILLTQAAKAFFVSLFSLIVFRIVIERHMIDISNKLRSFTPEDEFSPFHLKRPAADKQDELDQIVQAFNTMAETLKRRETALSAAQRKMNEEEHARIKAESEMHEAKIIAESFAESSAKIKNIIEMAPFPIVIFNKETKAIEFFNKTSVELFCIKKTEKIDIGVDKIFKNPNSINEIICLVNNCGGASQIEYEITGRNGTNFWALVSAVPLYNFSKYAVMLAISDISLRKRWEEETADARDKAEAALSNLRRAQDDLVRAEKLASLGGLVAGVAHEVNTPIGSALTGITYLRELTSDIRCRFVNATLNKSSFSEYLSSAEESCALVEENLQRAAELIQSFKQAAVDQTSEERRFFVLSENIRDVFNSLQHQIRKSGHKFEINCSDDIVIDGYPGALFQVLTNLTTNVLAHAYLEGEPGVIRVAACVDDASVVIRFADEGRGVAQEHHDRLFEPFFTTRRGAGGSGLGLHIVYNIVNQHLKGEIRFLKETTVGAAFLIRMPLVM
jgi:C4-dicarboxylate-specific signal transduction histidine kinase